MNTRANQGGSAVVYIIVSVLLALGVIGAVYAVQQRASGEQIAPMDIAATLNPGDEKKAEKDSADQQTNEQTQSNDAADKKSAEEQAAQEQQAAEEKKAEQQRQAAADEARQQEEKQAAEQKATQQQAAEEKATDDSAPVAQPASPEQMPNTGGPATLPQTGPSDYLFGGLALGALVLSILKYSFSHRFVTGR